jgi:hypothetical protein
VLLLDLLRMMYSHTNLVIFKGNVRLLHKSVLGRLPISGDWFLREIDTILVHRLLVAIGIGR